MFKDLTIFDGFEISGIREFDRLRDGTPVYEQCEDDLAELFSLYGHYDPSDFNEGIPFAHVGLECILDFACRSEAEAAKAYFEHFRREQLASTAQKGEHA